jgi:hypothetical protein
MGYTSNTRRVAGEKCLPMTLALRVAKQHIPLTISNKQISKTPVRKKRIMAGPPDKEDTTDNTPGSGASRGNHDNTTQGDGGTSSVDGGVDEDANKKTKTKRSSESVTSDRNSGSEADEPNEVQKEGTLEQICCDKKTQAYCEQGMRICQVSFIQEGEIHN